MCPFGSVLYHPTLTQLVTLYPILFGRFPTYSLSIPHYVAMSEDLFFIFQVESHVVVLDPGPQIRV